jgi:predicted nucleotidyltransferase
MPAIKKESRMRIQQIHPLSEIVQVIVEVAHPEQVILFGSRARGTASEDSDYDLLVIVPDVQNEREVSRRVYRALLERKIGAAVDVIVVGAEKLRQHRENPFYIYRQALREGSVFYDHRGS